MVASKARKAIPGVSVEAHRETEQTLRKFDAVSANYNKRVAALWAHL
jgi:hypothetical protein